MAEIVSFLKRKPCPICKRVSDAKHHPFCSPRCREVDLGRWLKGDYAMPVVEDEAGDNGPQEEV